MELHRETEKTQEVALKCEIRHTAGKPPGRGTLDGIGKAPAQWPGLPGCYLSSAPRTKTGRSRAKATKYTVTTSVHLPTPQDGVRHT